MNDTCPKCNGSMVEGWLPEVGQGTKPTFWVEGRPESSFWTGTKVDKAKSHPLVAHACRKCGFVEHWVRWGDSLG